MGDNICPYCGLELPVLVVLTSTPVYGRCDCDGATAARARIEAQKKAADAARQKAEAELRYQQRVASSGLPRRYQEGRLSDFDGSHNSKALSIARDYIDAFGDSCKTGKGLYLIGDVGRGKTKLAAAIAVEIMALGYTARYASMATILDQIKAGFGSDNTETALSRYASAHLLVIDDLGKEHHSEWSESVLFQVVNDRYERQRPLIITSNLGIADITRRYTWGGTAIASRIQEMCRGVLMTGPDRRIAS